MKTEMLEKKADEELRLNEKMKELAQLQKQFHDAIAQEQEAKLRLGHQQQERIQSVQDDMKNELDKVYQSHQKELDSYEQKMSRLRDDKANAERETAKA